MKQGSPRWRTFTAAALLTMVLGGCAGREPLAVTEVLNLGSCQVMRPGVNRVDWRRLAEIRGSRLLGMESAPEAPSSELALVAISRGTQPTPGYAFALNRAWIDRPSQNGTAVGVLELDWITPAPDAVLAQVVTHPCIVVGVDAGAVAGLRAVLSDGTEIGALDL